MIPVIVTPYAFRGSIVRMDDLVIRLKDFGYRSALIADPNFHAHVLFNVKLREAGLVPIHAITVGKKLLIAKNREGFNNLIAFKNKGIKKLKGVIVKDFSSFHPVMYLDRYDRDGYEIMRKLLGLSPMDEDLSLKPRMRDPSTIARFEVYDLRETQHFPDPPRDWIDLEKLPKSWLDRLKMEINIVKKKGFEGYFRAVQIVVDTARKNGIEIGPGRGSAVGSLLAHVLGITSVNPLDYDLLFERFINEGREEMPDVDIDVEDERRRELVKLLEGEFEFVSLISTYATLQESSLRKVVPRGKDRIFKLLKGLPVKRSIHAAGVLLSSKPLNVPYYTDGDLKVCEYDMRSLKMIGLEKIDILGLKTLSFLKMLSNVTGKDYRKLRKDDPETYEMISSGMTSAIFQLESSQARRISKYVSPKNIKQLSHVLALNRPGPLKSKMHLEYLKRRLGKPWNAPEKVFDVLEETLGLPIYQEQIMMMAVRMAGMTLSEADELRKAMAKKDRERMEKVLKDFEDGMMKSGYEKTEIEKTVNFIKEFASYAFNKSHSIAYSHISYYLSYYKKHFFPQFMLTFVKHSPHDREKLNLLMMEGRYMGYRILNPSVLQPEGGYGDGWIRLPLSVVKGTGADVIEKIKGMTKPRVSDVAKTLGMATTENLIKSGAFDELYESRKQALRSLKVGEPAKVLEKLKERFGKIEETVKPESVHDKILLEMESMGFALTVPDFKSSRPKIAEAFAVWEARISHVLSMGDGIFTDGMSVIATKEKGIPTGELVIVVNPETGVSNWSKKLDVKIECDKSKMNVKIGCWERFKRG